jgi:RIO kinase 1
MPRKQSYESHPDVQRWLLDQAREHDLENETFGSRFLAARRDGDWIMSSLAVFYQQQLILDVVRQASSGKEATVYCCIAHPETGADLLAAKIYRPRMFRSLRNDSIYREHRAQRDERGRKVHDRRGRRAATSDSARGRKLQVESWIREEYAIQQAAFAAGAAVPRPVAQIGNAVLMEYIGDHEDPAPRLSDIRLDREEAQPLFVSLMRDIELLLGCHVIHGDLSAYNILYFQGDAIVIDFAQAVDPRYGEASYTLLARDVERVCRYFARYGVEADAAGIAADLWVRYQLGELAPPLAVEE